MNRIIQSILLSALVVSASAQANPFHRQLKHTPGVYLAWACAMGAVGFGIGWGIAKLFSRTPARTIQHINEHLNTTPHALVVQPYCTIRFDPTDTDAPATPTPARKYSDYELRELRIKTTAVMPLFPGCAVNPAEEAYVDSLQQTMQQYADDCGQNILDTLDARRRKLIHIQRMYGDVLRTAPRDPQLGYTIHQRDTYRLKALADAYAHAKKQYNQLVEHLISQLETITIQ